MIKSYDTQTVGSAMINAIVAQEVKRQRDARVAALESENAELRRKLEIRKRRERQASKAARAIPAPRRPLSGVWWAVVGWTVLAAGAIKDRLGV